MAMPSIVINNNVVAAPIAYAPQQPVYAVSGPNHALHLILTFFTCGFWLPIWVIIAAVNHRTVRAVNPSARGFVADNALLVVSSGLFSLMVAIAFWQVALPLVAIGLIVWGVVVAIRRSQRQAEQRRRADAEIAARADFQHQAMMRGHTSTGTFGQYQPDQPDQGAPLSDAEQMRQTAWQPDISIQQPAVRPDNPAPWHVVTQWPTQQFGSAEWPPPAGRTPPPS